MIWPIVVLGGIAVIGIARAIRRNGGSMSSYPNYPIVTIDPGVDTAHQIGELPCPVNPGPPAGFQIWTGGVSSAMSTWAKYVLNTYPMGTFIQDIVDGQLIAARVEWHTWRGATGETGICIKGVTLFRPI